MDQSSFRLKGQSFEGPSFEDRIMTGTVPEDPWRPQEGLRAGALERPRINGRRIFRIASIAFASFLIAPYFLTLVYAVLDPPVSAFMVRYALTGHAFTREWRDLDSISPNLVSRVLVSEDDRFCDHWGVDWGAIGDAFNATGDGRPRGASTITMQTVKNLFFWNRPAYIRKVFELPLSYYVDFVLGKRRVLELYLNIAEWGPGVFGAEAAAQYHFGVTAAELSAQEGAQLAVALPNPVKRNAGNPGPAAYARAARLQARAARTGNDVTACILAKR